MKIQKSCKTCGKEFTAIKTTQYFCSRKCFRKDYHHRKREEEANRPIKFPAYTCQDCGRRSILDFDPLDSIEKLDTYNCPYCDFCPRQGWDNRNTQVRIEMRTFGAYSSTSLIQSMIISKTLSSS